MDRDEPSEPDADGGSRDRPPEAYEAAAESYPPESGVPTVTCTQCDQEWELGFELDELQAGNRALEQFAMDHYRHTGHYPDDVTPWVTQCRQCPAGEEFLAERPARRFATTHARHTTHTVELEHPDTDGGEAVRPPGE